MTKNLRFAMSMFKMMECCSKPYNIECVGHRSVLKYQHQKVLKQKMVNDIQLAQVNKNNWMKIMKAIVLHLRLVMGVQGINVLCSQKLHQVAYISTGYSTYLNLDEQMIARAPLIDMKLNLKMIQEGLDRAYFSWQCSTFKVNNAFVNHILKDFYGPRCIRMCEKQEEQPGWSRDVL